MRDAYILVRNSLIRRRIRYCSHKYVRMKLLTTVVVVLKLIYEVSAITITNYEFSL